MHQIQPSSPFGTSLPASIEERSCPARRLVRTHRATVANDPQPGTKRGQMRSNLVYAAGLKIHNRFLLASTVMLAVRKLHIEATRTEDTINRVFSEVADSTQIIGKLPAITPPPTIDALLITP
jgi:hypothetical protein